MSNSLILIAITNTLKSEQQGPNYFRRARGSYLEGIDRNDGQGTADMLSGMADRGDFHEVTEEIRARADGSAFGQCRYFAAQVPEGLVGMECIRQVKDLSDEELAAVQVLVAQDHREGADNSGQLVNELVLPSIPSSSTDTLHLCIGNEGNPFEAPTEENAVVFFWYPGKITPKVDIPAAAAEFTPAQLREHLPLATVKLGEEAQLTIEERS